MWLAVVAGVLVALVVATGALWITDPFGVFADRQARADSRGADQQKALVAKLQRTLDARAKALLSGDEAGWLAPVDPGAKDLVASQRRVLRTLQEMGIGRYHYRVRNVGRPGGSTEFVATMSVDYCFGDQTCRVAESDAVATFRRHGGDLVMVEYTPTGVVRPWDVSELRIASGRRAVVAAQPEYAHLMDGFRLVADRVARRAERFVPPGGVAKHLIFIGVPGKDTDSWYGEGLDGRDVTDYHDLVSPGGDRIAAVEHVVRGDKIGDLSWDALGFGVARGAAAIGLNETDLPGTIMRTGIAQHVSRGNPADYRIGKEVRKVLGDWNGELERFYPSGGADVDWRAWYIAGWVVVHRLIDRYGEKRFAAFYNAVARDGEDYEEAAPEHLGASLKAVQSDLKKRLRSLAA